MKYTYQEKRILPFDEPKYVRNRWVLDMFNRYEEYYRPEISRIHHNQRMYWGVNFGQWPAYVVEVMRQQGRKPPTYNIIAKKIESQIGSYISNGLDLKYQTISGQKTNWSDDLRDMAYDDSLNLDWETSEIVALRDMHCCVGYMRMVISERFNATFGNIGWEAAPPTHIYISPSWKSPYAYDINDYFDWGMFSVREIINTFPKMEEELKEWREREERNGMNYGEYHAGPRIYQSTEEKWGDYHKVITFHSVELKRKKWMYDLVNRCSFPETGFPDGSAKEKEVIQMYMQKMGLQEGQYVETEKVYKEKHIEVICPTLHNEMFLAAGKDRIQTNNCNIYPMGNSFYGQFRGAVDDLDSTQVDFNKGEMTIMDMQQRMAKGMLILDKALARGDSKKMKEIESRMASPAARVWVEEGTTADLGPNSGIIDIKGHAPTPDMFRQSDRRLNLADWLSTMPAAMDARTEGSNESGKLYQSKVQVALISQKYGMKQFERNKRERMMAYPLQAKITYSGFSRDFTRMNGADALSINVPGMDMSGRRVMINDISMMPEMKVTLVPSTHGLDFRSELKTQYTDTLNVLSDPADRLLKLIMIEGIYDMQDLPDEKKESLRKALMILQKIAASEQMLRMYELQMQFAQLGIQPEQEQKPEVSANEGFFDENQARTGTPQDVLMNNQ